MIDIQNCRVSGIKRSGQGDILWRRLVISPMKQYRNVSKSRQRNQEKKIQEVPLYKRTSNNACEPPFWARSNNGPLEGQNQTTSRTGGW